MDPVDILTPLEKSGFWEGVKVAKWSERWDDVAELNKLASTKKIAPGDFSEICRTLKKLVTDVNLDVSVEAIQAIGNLARGLRNHFAMGPAIEKSSKGILADVLKILGDNKKHMRESTLNTLDAWIGAVELDKMDKSADVRKAAEVTFAKILRVCDPEAVTKNIKDLRGPAVALVSERLKPSGIPLHGISDLTKSVSLPLKSAPKGKGHNGFADHVPKHGSKSVSSRGASVRASKSVSSLSVQDLAVQSQALFNVKDSNKIGRDILYADSSLKIHVRSRFRISSHLLKRPDQASLVLQKRQMALGLQRFLLKLKMLR